MDDGTVLQSLRQLEITSPVHNTEENPLDVLPLLEITCPNTNCNSQRTKPWYCSKGKPLLYVSRNGMITCKGCNPSHVGRIIDWQFSCSQNCFIYPGDCKDFLEVWLTKLQLSDADRSKLSYALTEQQTSGRRKSIKLLATQELDEYIDVDYSEYFDIQKFDFSKRPPPELFEDDMISDSARETCNTIITGFEMTVTQYVLFDGYVDTKSFAHTLNATKMLNTIRKNNILWFADKQKEMFHRISKLEALLTAIRDKDHDAVMRIYYRSQHIHTFDEQNRPLDIQVYVNEDRLNCEWIPHIKYAIEQINIAAPGINLMYENKYLNENINSITIGIDDKLPGNYACVNLDRRYPFVHLGSDWPPKGMKGTAIHELLHALGFEHAMSRFDSSLYVDVNTANLDDTTAYQYKSRPSYGILTRFDPFSVMMYPENDILKRTEGDQIWKLKKGCERSNELSELDKVALNLMYKPCKCYLKYSPVISETTKMLYCGREVMQFHNQNVPPTLTSLCGPQVWANCPSCRVFKDVNISDKNIKISTVKKCLDLGKWQGLSGNFYCGKKFAAAFKSLRYGLVIESNGECGPDQGIPCTDCGRELKPGYSYTDFNIILNEQLCISGRYEI